jgi:hypothetical protein
MASPRRAHHVVGVGLPSVGEWAATSPHINTCQTKSQREEGAPPLESVGCHLKGAPLPTPPIHPPIQTNSGTPSTSAYTLSTSEISMPSYVPYRSQLPYNLYFSFPSPP